MENFTFDTIEYHRPDLEALKKDCMELTERLRNAKSYAEVREIIDLSDKTAEAETMMVVAHVRNTLNTTDKFYEEELAWIGQNLPEAQPVLMEFSKALAESPFATEIDADLGPEFLTAVRRDLSSFRPEII